MKKVLLLVLLVFAAWKGCDYLDRGSATATPDPLPLNAVAPPPASKPAFRCDGRQHCSQMTSREEAEYFVRHCPDTKMDGDHDGIPCENDSRF
jgi:hypothetical protein